MAYVIISEIVVLFSFTAASVFCWFFVRHRTAGMTPEQQKYACVDEVIAGSILAALSMIMLGVVAATFLGWRGWIFFMAV